MTLNNLGLNGERDLDIMMPFPVPGFPDEIPLRDGVYYATLLFVPPHVGQWLGLPEAPLISWDEQLLAYVDGVVDTPVFAVANSDAHNTAEIDSHVGIAKNGVYLKKLTAKEFYKAIKAGRSFATTGPSLDLDVNGELMGDTAEISRGTAEVNLSVNAENQNATLVKIEIIKNGLLWQTIWPTSSVYEAVLQDDSVTEDGYYRVEVTSCEEPEEPLEDYECGSYQFAWSNPVFVRID